MPNIEKEFLIQQGDVLIMAVLAVPRSAKPVETNDTAILAHGEATGHSHHLRGPQVAMFRDDGAGGGGATYLRVLTPTPLEHGAIGQPETADHATLQVIPTTHEVRRQVEWSDVMDRRPIPVRD